MSREQELLNEAKNLIEKANELIANAEKLIQNTEKEDILIDLEKEDGNFQGNGFISIKSSGEYSGISFYLNEAYNWELKMDYLGFPCLIPTKRIK